MMPMLTRLSQGPKRCYINLLWWFGGCLRLEVAVGLPHHQVSGNPALAAAPAFVLWEQLVWCEDRAAVRAQCDMGCDTQAVRMPLDLCFGRGFLQAFVRDFTGPAGATGRQTCGVHDDRGLQACKSKVGAGSYPFEGSVCHSSDLVCH